MSNQLENRAFEVREELMQYYKGSCIERLFNKGNVEFYRLDYPHEFQYQREQGEREDKRAVHVEGQEFAIVSRHPSTITFHDSPDFTNLRQAIEKFLETYLPEVERHTVSKKATEKAKAGGPRPRQGMNFQEMVNMLYTRPTEWTIDSRMAYGVNTSVSDSLTEEDLPF